MEDSVGTFQELLLTWYAKNGRRLVWRDTATPTSVTKGKSNVLRNPYFILVSEMMLQQTQVATVLPKYRAFLSRFPTLEALSQARLSEVIVAWKGLGYNRRAKYLLETAKLIVHQYDSRFPEDENVLRTFPGFGVYMTRAVRVFAFGKQEVVIDVNVARVLSRAVVGQETVGRKELENIAGKVLPPGQADAWHQALMDFGATVCTRKTPLCDQCIVASLCKANQQATQEGYASYTDKLRAQPRTERQSKKDRGKRFEETDRYFRGRIIDTLREGKKPMEELYSHIYLHHHLEDRVRFGRLIESLLTDGLIQIQGTEVLLA